MRSSLYWNFMQCWLVVSNWCFRTTFQSHLQGSNFWIVWPLTTGQMGYPETSTTNSQSVLCNIPEEWRSHLLCCRSLKSHIFGIVCSGLHVLHMPIDTTSNVLWMHITGVKLNISIVLMVRIQGRWFVTQHSKIIDCWHFEGTYCLYFYLFIYFILFFLIFIIAPCILISSKSFIYERMHFISVLEHFKIYIKTYIKIAPTCFDLRPSSGSLRMSLAKVNIY